MIRQRISAWLKRIPKQDVICIIILLLAGIFTRLLLVLNTPFLYGQDAYLYVGEAREFASSGTIELNVGMSFVLTVGAFLKVLGPIFGDINASRLFMLLSSAVLVLILYMLGVRMKSRLFGLVAALLATFEPFFLEWSTVPYREVFAISAGLLSLYFALSDKRLQRILSLIFFYLSIATRPELYLALIVPMLIIYLSRIFKIRSQPVKRVRLLVPLILALIIYVLPFVGIYFYVQSWGTFSVSQRIALFFTPGLLSTTLDLTFKFYDQQLWNRILYVFVWLVLAFIILKTVVHVSFQKGQKRFPISIQFNGAQHIKDTIFSDKGMIAFCLLFVFAIYTVVLTIFAYGYNWAFFVSPPDLTNVDVLRAAVIIIPRLPVRYLILLRLLISYPLAYPLVLVAQRVWSEIGYEK